MEINVHSTTQQEVGRYAMTSYNIIKK